MKMVAVISDSQGAIQRMGQLQLDPGQRLMRWISQRVQVLLARGIASEIHWVPEYSVISGNVNAARL
jgi:hypothetical protein